MKKVREREKIKKGRKARVKRDRAGRNNAGERERE